jgi:hypothetical protein
MFGMLITVVAYVFFFVLVTVIVTSVSVSKDLGDRAVSIEGVKYGLNRANNNFSNLLL